MTEQKLSATDAALRRRITELSVHVPCGQQWVYDDGSICPTVDASGRPVCAPTTALPSPAGMAACSAWNTGCSLRRQRMIITGITVEQFKQAVDRAGANYRFDDAPRFPLQGRYAQYGHNLRACIGTEYNQTRFSARVIPLFTANGMYRFPKRRLAPGQRRSWQGRRINAVCWHADRDVLREVFATNPHAKVRTRYAKYLGIDGFLREYPKTARMNVGSAAKPISPLDLCECVSGVPSASTHGTRYGRTAPVRLVHRPTQEEQEMIQWWAEQSKRALARTDKLRKPR
jgi:hypothetical protein